MYRLGGCYVKGDAILAIGGVTVLREERSPEGVPLLSLDLNDAAGNSLLRIQENSLSIEDLALWDIHLSGQPDSLDCAAQEGFDSPRSAFFAAFS
jgi:hypothetical protein